MDAENLKTRVSGIALFVILLASVTMIPFVSADSDSFQPDTSVTCDEKMDYQFQLHSLPKSTGQIYMLMNIDKNNHEIGKGKMECYLPVFFHHRNHNFLRMHSTKSGACDGF